MAQSNQLDRDILLNFRCTHGKKSHCSETTEYVANEHAVVRSLVNTRLRWLPTLPPKVVKTRDVLEIPEEITDPKELEMYVRKHRPHWMRGR